MDRFTELLQDEDKLVKPTTLAIGLVALSVVLIGVNAGLVTLLPTWRLRQLLFDAVILIGWVVYWTYKKKQLPKNKSDKVGIVIALTTEKDKEKVRVKNDLVRKLGEVILADGLQEWVTIIPLNNPQANRIIPSLNTHAAALSSKKFDSKAEKQWAKIRTRINGHFYIYGYVSERGGSENAYSLNTNALVLHPLLLPDVQKQLSADFVDLWVNEFNFLEKLEKAGFDFTARYWYVGAQYIIGYAALACGDVTTALRLHKAAQNKIDILKIKPAAHARIEKRLGSFLGQEYSMIAFQHEARGELTEAKKLVADCFQVDPNNYSGHLLQARIEFAEGNPHKALKTIERLKRIAGRDRTWMYSQAFLLFYLEQFDKGLAAYRKIANYSFPGEIDSVIPQIIAFNEQRLQFERQKIQSHFILGYIKMKKSHNYPEALEHFETFLEKAKEPKYRPLVEETQKCVRELHQIMGLETS